MRTTGENGGRAVNASGRPSEHWVHPRPSNLMVDIGVPVCQHCSMWSGTQKGCSFVVLVLAASAPCEARADSEVLTGQLLTARALHTATLLPNGKVLAASGYSETLGNLVTAELYDPST